MLVAKHACVKIHLAIRVFPYFTKLTILTSNSNASKCLKNQKEVISSEKSRCIPIQKISFPPKAA